MVQSLSNAMMMIILADARKSGAKRLKASLIASMIVYYWVLKISSFVSSIVVLPCSARDGKGFAAPMLFGAFTPPFRRAYARELSVVSDSQDNHDKIGSMLSPDLSSGVRTGCERGGSHEIVAFPFHCNCSCHRRVSFVLSEGGNSASGAGCVIPGSERGRAAVVGSCFGWSAEGEDICIILWRRIQN